MTTARTYVGLLAQPAAAGTGVLAAKLAPGDVDGVWFVAQVALPAAGSSIFGSVVAGDGHKFNEGVEWFDVSSRFRGANWSRGATSPGDRWRVGAGTLELNNTDESLSRWPSSTPAITGVASFARQWYGPGALIRLGLRILDAGPFVPLFTGIVSRWRELSPAVRDLNRHVLIEADETLSSIATTPGSVVAAEGAGDSVIERAQRILDVAEWAYSTSLAVTNEAAELYGSGAKFGAVGLFYSRGLPAMSATTLDTDRLAELYAAADASWCQFHSGRDGAARLTLRELPTDPTLATDLLSDGPTQVGSAESTALGYSAGIVHVSYQPGIEVDVEDDDATRNVITLARAGGSDIVTTSLTSRQQLGPREHVNRAVPLQSDTDVTRLGQLMLDALAFPRLLAKPVKVHSVSTGLYRLLVMVSRSDLGKSLPLWWKPPAGGGTTRLRLWTRVNGEQHQVTAGLVAQDRLTWQTTYNLDNHAAATVLGAGFTT